VKGRGGGGGGKDETGILVGSARKEYRAWEKTREGRDLGGRGGALRSHICLGGDEGKEAKMIKSDDRGPGKKNKVGVQRP